MDGTDDILLHKIRKGNTPAFEQFFRKYYEAMHAHAYKFVWDSSTAEEITQEMFIHLWEKRTTLQIHGSTYKYLAKAIRNRCINYLKSSYNQRTTIGDLPDEAQPIANTTEQSLSAWELEQILSQAIQLLPENCRIVFNLSRQAGLTYDEIATELGVSKETVKTQIKIALKKLRTFLKEHWEYIPVLF